MKLCIALLLLCCTFVYSHVQTLTPPVHFTGDVPELNEEQKIQMNRGLVPAKKFVRELMEIYKKFTQIRKKVTRRQEETAEVIEYFSKINLKGACKQCQGFFQEVIKIADFKVFRNIAEKIAEEICVRKVHHQRAVCHGAIQSFGEIAYAAVLDRALNPLHVCEKLAMCPRTTHREKLADYIKDVLKDKPDTLYPRPAKKETYKVLQLTDPHIDLEYLEGSNAKCTEPLCCRADTGSPKSPSDVAGYWGTIGSCDIPLRTFDQFLKFASSQHKIDMVLWLGDNNAHDIWKQNQKTITDNTYEATQKLLHYFPNVSIYPMFGNHEPYPADQFDFITNTTSWLTDRLANMWKPWLDEKAYQTFKEQSYYSMVNEKFNLKVIALDMLACDINDFYLIRNPTDPNHQLEWLRNELYHAEKERYGVYIIGHIPPGDYGCASEWSGRYKALVDRFTNTIRGQFFGHSHNDHYQLVRSYTDDSAVGAAFISASMTTYSNLLPSFRIYEMDAETNQPINYWQYRLDLNKWNKDSAGPIEWDLAYTALEEYGLEDLSFASLDTLADRVLNDKNTALKYVNNVYSGHHINDINPRDLKHLYCGLKTSVSEDNFKCLGHDATTGDLMNLAKSMMPGRWFYDKC